MAKFRWIATDGPLKDEEFALESDVEEFSIKLSDGRVVVYKKDKRPNLYYLGMDPFA